VRKKNYHYVSIKYFIILKGIEIDKTFLFLFKAWILLDFVCISIHVMRRKRNWQQIFRLKIEKNSFLVSFVGEQKFKHLRFLYFSFLSSLLV